MSRAARGALVSGVLLLVALALGFAHALIERRADAENRRITLQRLEKLGWLLQNHDLGETTVDIPPPRALGDSRDPTGMLALHQYLMGGHYLLETEPGTVGSALLLGELTHDAWGRPIRYRNPGGRGRWEFSSLGADGIEDGGAHDDIVFGAYSLGSDVEAR